MSGGPCDAHTPTPPSRFLSGHLTLLCAQLQYYSYSEHTFALHGPTHDAEQADAISNTGDQIPTVSAPPPDSSEKEAAPSSSLLPSLAPVLPPTGGAGAGSV